MGCKKKLYKPPPSAKVEAQRTRGRTTNQPSDPASLERGVRQLLADKVSGHLVGAWLLVPEHLRLKTWDLLCGWSGHAAGAVEPRLALQMVQEASLCTTGIRSDRTLTNRGGFELVNGLPFIASDKAMHELLAAKTVQEAMRLQVALGKIRRASGHFRGVRVAIDPHRTRSWSQRQMRYRAKDRSQKPIKMSQTFWALDADTQQPLGFTTGTSSRSVAQATPELLDVVAEILGDRGSALVLADSEHFTAELIDDIHRRHGLDLLVPMPSHGSVRKRMQAIPAEAFTRHWAGFATTKVPYQMTRGDGQTYWQFVQRTGERPEDWRYKGFLSTRGGDEAEALTLDYPTRWHVEEFFNSDQALGWKRAGTQNLNIRYGQMTMALLAQAAIHQLRGRLGEPLAGWDANHLAKDLFQGLDGDVRVTEDTILVTYYNARNVELLRSHYEHLPQKLRAEDIDPRIPWLYNFKLDFRFR